jgi:hypothetical protein
VTNSNFFGFFFFFFFGSSSVCVARRSRGGNTHRATAGMERYDKTRMMMIHSCILLAIVDGSIEIPIGECITLEFIPFVSGGRTDNDGQWTRRCATTGSVGRKLGIRAHHTVRSFVSGKPPVDGFGGSDLCMGKQYMSWIENIYRVQSRFCHRWHYWMDGFFQSVCTYTISLDPFGFWMLDAPPPRGVVCSILIWID